MSFETVTKDDAMRDYEAHLDAIGAMDPQRAILVDAMRASLEDMDSLIVALTPNIATGELLDLWYGKTEPTPQPNHVRDAVNANR